MFFRINHGPIVLILMLSFYFSNVGVEAIHGAYDNPIAETFFSVYADSSPVKSQNNNLWDGFFGKDIKWLLNFIPGRPSDESTDRHALGDYQLFNVSELCQKDVDEITAGVHNRTRWSLQMVDSNFKPEAGILTGNVRWSGDYEECFTTEHSYRVEDSARTFRGRYCGLVVHFKTLGNRVFMFDGAENARQFSFPVGLCVPDSCNGNDIVNIIQNYLEQSSFKKQVAVKFGRCEAHGSSYTIKAIVALTVSGTIMLLMVIGTIYDISLLYKIQKENQQDGTVNASSVSSHDISHETSKIQVTKQPKKKRVGIFGKVLLAFSVYTNTKQIIDSTGGNSTLKCVHGIRFLSMTWVMVGHTYSSGARFLMDLPFADSWAHRFAFQVVDNESVSVDSFFTLSGLLLTYLTLSEMKQKNGRINWIMFYFHRYYRLTMPYALVMLFYAPLYHHWYYGPFWSDKSPEGCSENWWHNLLYINNIVKGHGCMAVTWYLGNDMQFFVLSPLIIVPVYFWPRIGYVVWTVFLLTTTITAAVISNVNMFTPSSLGPHHKVPHGMHSNYNDYYRKPWCRMGPYLVGMAAGYAIFKTGGQRKMSHWLRISGWFAAALVACAVVYGLLRTERKEVVTSVEVGALYNSLSRTAWGAALSWVIYACVTGNGGFVNTILSWGGFLPLGRLGFMAYLFHFYIITFFYNSRRDYFYATDLKMVFTFVGIASGTYIVALVLALAFESPMVGLEKVIFNREKRS